MKGVNVDTATEFFVYRWFDADGVLLYIGVTYDLQRRAQHHATKSEWHQFADRVTSTTIATWSDAVRAEREAIRTERSVFNLTDNDVDAAGRRSAYLLAHPPRPKRVRVGIQPGPKATGRARTAGLRVPLNAEELARVRAWAEATDGRSATLMRDALMREVEKWERAERRRTHG